MNWVEYGKDFDELAAQDLNVPGTLLLIRKPDGSLSTVLLGHCDWEGHGEPEQGRWLIEGTHHVVRYAIAVPGLQRHPR